MYISVLPDTSKLFFVLISYIFFAFIPSLTGSASLPHIDIFSCVIKLYLGFCYHYIPWILCFFFLICSVLLPAALLHSFLFVPVGLCTLGLFLPSFSLSPISFHLQSHIRDNREMTRVSWTQARSWGWGNVSLLHCRSCPITGFAAIIDYNQDKPVWSCNRNWEKAHCQRHVILGASICPHLC